MAADITIRPLHFLDDFHRCVQITRDVWGDSELETEPYITFVLADHIGGQVLGAFDGDTLVGFTKAFVGMHDHTPYLHSHMAAVLPDYRDRHIGRQLKLAQREHALRRDIRRIEWTFDPLETRNAHFNINRLGGMARQYLPNLYGITSSPLHRGLPTDRLLVEWHLESPRVIAAISDLSHEASECPAAVHLPGSPGTQPASSAPHGSARESGSSGASYSVAAVQAPARSAGELLELQSHLRASLTEWFSKGYALTSVRFAASGVDYCLTPYSDF
jgi:predicted GNAT superfamily acetyltransferase